MQNLPPFAAFVLFSLVIVCPGHSHQPMIAPFTSGRGPHPVYGAPPQTWSVATGVVHPLGSAGSNYGVQIPLPNQFSHGHRTPIPLANNFGPKSHSNGDFEFANNVPQHFLLPTPSQPKPFYQPLTSVPNQHSGNGVAASNTHYTHHYTPLLTPQSSQSISQTSLSPATSAIFSNQSNHFQQQPFSLSQPSAGTNANVPNSQFGSTTRYQAVGSSLNGIFGNYISQSEVGQLDQYLGKQAPAGDTRAYSRTVTTCYPDGRCEQQQLGSGQPDAGHQQNILSARPLVQSISNKCQALAAQSATQTTKSGLLNSSNSPQSSHNQPPNRPPNRRRYQYTETLIPRDPFN